MSAPIEAKLLVARRERVDLLPTTLSFTTGRHALLGRREDGPHVLLACLAGDVRPKRGSVTVLGGAPWSPAVRARVGVVPLGLRLPEALRVDELLALERKVRRDEARSASDVLAPLGLESLARRRGDSLDAGEARAVALASALALRSVTVLLVEEPFVAMAPSAAAALPGALAARQDVCVVVATASVSDASRVAQDFALFDRGRLVRVVAEAPLRAGSQRPRVEIVADDLRALAAELAKRPEVEEMTFGPRAVVVDGSDPSALAAAIQAAVVDAAVSVQRIEPWPTTLEELREHARALAAASSDPRPTPGGPT